MRPRIMTVYGTRPEAVKVAPVVQALAVSATLAPVTVVTGQHREMLDQVNDVFGIVPDHDLDVFAAGQSLNVLMAKVLARLDPLLEAVRPDAVLVQGDTTTVAAAAGAAFHRRVPVFHLEAGLRSGDLSSPFPEEANRRVTSQVTSLHLAPTAGARANLVREHVDAGDVVVTGNTVIDALLHAVGRPTTVTDPRLRAAMAAGRPLVLVTVHRRESWGAPLAGIGRAVARLALMLPGHTFVLPLHRNPTVREALLPAVAGLGNVVVTEPLPYGEFTAVMAASSIVVTDSGGVQEEAPALGKPVLVMRENTERPEAVEAGTVRLVGTEEEAVVAAVAQLATDPDAYAAMSRAVNPYGDGRAGERVVAAIEAFFGLGARMPDFEPELAGV